MRLHIELDDEIVAQVDALSGSRGRSAFVRSAVQRAVRQEHRWSEIEAAAGAIPDTGHEWDADPAAWVRQQRHSDARRAG